jgi:UDP-hydrolysing UDP-N-acetyl-D-glucosamine 2-epimerase
VRLAVLTTGRHDWGILQLLVEALRAEDAIVTVLHEEGHTVNTASAVYDHLLAGFIIDRPDALIVLGDRYETLMAAMAATVSKVPIIHLHGGEVSQGAFDDQIRHAISRLAQLHLVASEDAKRYLESSGERSVVLTGAVGTDWAFRGDVSSRVGLEKKLGKRLKHPLMLVSVHPETLGQAGVEIQAVAYGRTNPGTTVYFLPNLDPGHEEVRAVIEQAPRPQDILVERLSAADYWGLMKLAKKMVGNSSSLVLEAPALGVETIIIGERQKGRKPPMRADGRAASRAAQAILAWRPTLRKPPAPQDGYSPCIATAHTG